ncbi:MAG: L-threonylcarbamoyladenylate synthase, partial [Deefgea sp.]
MPNTPAIPDLSHALALLRAGELVGIPTETVYGLAADASQPAAVAKIFAAKGRPNDHPVIVHIAGIEQLSDWAQNIPDSAYQLANAFWPGPLTLILERQDHVSDSVTGGQNTVGLRAPAHPITHELLTQFGGGLAAPSANQFGHVSPTTAEHVRHEFTCDQLELILDGGACHVGVESTIVSLVGGVAKLLRPGGISRAAIEAVLGTAIEHHT